MRRLGVTAAIVGLLIAGLAGCSGDDDDAGESTGGGAAEEAGEAEEIDVDSCTLVTNEEASALAGTELAATEDSPLGCAYVGPGETVGDFTVHSFRGEGDAAAAGAELVPAAEAIPLDGLGDDAVALNIDGSVNFIVARQDDLFLVFVTTFLGITPGSTELDRAADLAGTALERLADAAA